MRHIPFGFMNKSTPPIPIPFVATVNTITNFRTVSFPYISGATYNGTIDWGDGTITPNSYANRSHTYATNGNWTITINGQIGKFNSFSNQSNTLRDRCTSILSFGNNFSFGIENTGGYFWAFNRLTSIASDIPIAGVTNMSYMFRSCERFNQDISSWDVSNVTNMSNMFEEAYIFNQNIGSWNVSNVTNMSSMFDTAQDFNQDISSWNVSNVIFMDGMFRSNSVFNQNISSWDVSNVIQMQGVFAGPNSAFNQNIGSWNVSNVIDMSNMFQSNNSLTTTNLNNIYNGWSALPSLQNFVTFNAVPCYTATAGRAILTGTYGWNITDGGVC